MMACWDQAETDDPDHSGEVAGSRYELALQGWPLHRFFFDKIKKSPPPKKRAKYPWIEAF
jgi:hypothetical protein